MAGEANETDTNQEVQKPDEIKNLKAEFSRKQENVLGELNQIKQMLQAQKQETQQRHQMIAEDDIPDPVLEPKKYKDYIKQEVLKETSSVVNTNNQRQSQLAALVQNYPELQDGSSELTKKAVDMYNKLSESEKMSPNAYKYAVQDAASELGVLAMSKRKQTQNDDGEDSYTMDSSNYQSNKRPSKQAKSDKLDDATLAFAEAIGRPVNDPKYIESLKKYNTRKNWNKGS